METFASLREYRVVRLNENKDRFIQKNTLLTDEQKAEVLDFFHSHANLEAKVNDGNWNYTIPYEEFKKVMDSVDTQAKRLKKQTKELRKQTGLEGLVEGTDYTIFKNTPEYIAYRPLTHKGMRVIASNMVEPKLWCKSRMMKWSPKEVLPAGEPMKGKLYPGAKWCVAMETDKHWKSYTKEGCSFIVVCSKDLNTEEELKKFCLVYKSWKLSRKGSTTAADVSLEKVQSNYVETVIRDLDTILHGEGSNFILEEIQRCYNPRSMVYELSKKVVSPEEFLRLGKLDHPVIWEGDFEVRGDIKSLVGCPGIVTGDFRCSNCNNLTSLEGAPREVGGDFWCSDCSSLTSLKGAPREVGKSFYCQRCYSLTSLQDAPKRVKGNFECHGCTSLTSLEGAPESVGGTFKCSFCKSLTSLKGAPEYVGGDFWCEGCRNLKSLKGAPREVGGDFWCEGCFLTTLEGASQSVGGSFRCDRTPLISLQGAPEYVGGYFDCSDCNNLTSLKGAPKEVGEDFHCRDCKSLASLEGAPEKIKGNFSCVHCDKLKSLEGAPKEVGGDFYCNDCSSLTSLEGAPEKVEGDFNCLYTSLKSLKGAPKYVGGDFDCRECRSLTSLKSVPKYVGGKVMH